MPLSIDLESPKTTPADKTKKPVVPEVAPAAAAAAPEPTPEELETRRKEFQDAMFSNEKPVKPEVKPAPVKPDPEKEKVEAEAAKKLEDEAAAEKAKKEKKPKPAKPIAPDPASDEDRLDDISKRVADKLKSAQVPDQKPQESTDDFNEQDRQVLEAAAKLQGSPKFKGRDLVAATKDFWKKEADYIAAWEAKSENAGEEFNVSDPVHAAFYKRNQPPYSDAELATASEQVKRDVLKREVLADIKREIEPQQKQQAAQDAYRQHAPAINQSVIDGVTAMVAESSPEFKKLMTGSDHQLSINPEILQKMEDADPVALVHIDNEAHILRAKISELETLDRLGEHVQPNINLRVKTPAGYVMPHLEIMEAGTALEDAVSKLPRADQLHEGKQFITRGELASRRNDIFQSSGLIDQKQAALQALDRKYWYITSSDIKAKFVADSVRKMQPFIAAAKKQLEKQKTNSDNKPEINGSKNVQSKPINKPSSPAPSVASSSDSVNTQLKPQDESGKNADEFVKAFF